MSEPLSPASGRSGRPAVSALADGEAPPDHTAAFCDAWSDDADARATWYAYQVIGDVLRGADLPCVPARDQAFLQTMRARLGQEAAPPRRSPWRRRAVVGAAQVARWLSVLQKPAPAPPSRLPASSKFGSTPPRWQGPVLLAIGLVVASGVSNLRRAPHGGSNAAQTLAQAGGSAAAAAASSSTPMPPSAMTGAGAREQLAPYLAAHRQSIPDAALRMPDAGVRNVSLVEPAP